MDRDRANGSRFEVGMRGGYYESWFQRANHVERPLAFWNRYTVFCPKDAPERATAELWGIWFDGEQRGIVAVREDVPIERCRFAKDSLDVRIGDATLDDRSLKGGAASGGRKMSWDLRFEDGGAPLLLMPESFYERRFPKAKALTGSPSCLFHGTFVVDGETHAVEGWRGAQSHNWGSAQTDEYAWAQVAGFDGAPESFFECGSGRLRLATCLPSVLPPLFTPRTSFGVLRHEGRTYSFDSLWKALRAPSVYDVGRMVLSLKARDGVELDVVVTAPKSAFVGLTYRNPPGGAKVCHNTKLARCDVTLRENGRAVALSSRRRAAFEILSDTADGVDVVI